MKRSELKKLIINEVVKIVREKADTMNGEAGSSDEDIFYRVFGEGPTFTSSQGGGLFWDFNVDKEIENGTFKKKGNKIHWTEELDLSVYFADDLDEFNSWWERNNKGGKIIDSAENNDDVHTQ